MIYNFFLILALSLLSGCAKEKKIQVPRLRSLSSYIDYQETKHGITLCAKKLSVDDCKPLFGKRSKFLFKKSRRKQPIYPIQLSISNQTESPISLKPKNISLSLTPCKDVVARVGQNTALQVVGGIACTVLAASLLVAGAVFALTSGGMFTALFGSVGASVAAPLIVIGLSAVIVTPFFLVIGTPVVSTLKGVHSAQKNAMLKQELDNKTLSTELFIDQGQTIDTVIFVSRSQYNKNFTITFTQPNATTQIATFHVDLLEE